MTKAPIISLRDVSKRFLSVCALKNVNLDFYAGEIHAIIGSNGAGKSTLIEILSGHTAMTSGQMLMDSRNVRFADVAEARQNGVFFCPQEIFFFDHMTVLENLVLGSHLDQRLYHRPSLAKVAQALFQELHIGVDLRKKGRQLSLAEKYLIQFARILLDTPRVVILDELTDSLTLVEAQIVYGILQRLREQDVAVIFITHRIDEAIGVADVITTMKDGEITSTTPASQAVNAAIKRGMLGKDIKEHYPKLRVAQGEPVLRVRHVSNRFLDDIDFSLHRGEILGIAGLVGSGRSSLLRAIVGLDTIDYGRTEYPGAAAPYIGYMPEHRDREGLFFNLPVSQNISIRDLSRVSRMGAIRYKLEHLEYQDIVDRLDIDVGGADGRIDHLSGGNKQKVLVGRSVFSKCGIFIFDEPTKGVDIAGKVEIYNILNELIRKGAAIVIVSLDFSELSGMCDRILAIKKGRIVGEFQHNEVDQQRLFSICGE